MRRIAPGGETEETWSKWPGLLRSQYVRKQLRGNPDRAKEPATGRVGLEIEPKVPKLALGSIRVHELGNGWKHVPSFQGLGSSLLVYSFRFFLY